MKWCHSSLLGCWNWILLTRGSGPLLQLGHIRRAGIHPLKTTALREKSGPFHPPTVSYRTVTPMYYWTFQSISSMEALVIKG